MGDKMKIQDFKLYKDKNKKISMITCYDYPSAQIIAESKIDSILIGDSVAMTVHGHKSTITATMEMMILHTKAVSRGIKQQFIVSDLPFSSYRISKENTMQNACALMQAGANAIKLEGADNKICEIISDLVTAGIPVMGHLGLTPQSIHQLGGYKIQGKENSDAEKIMLQAQNLQDAGVFALVLECVPANLAKSISQSLKIPTIGIGAGFDTDGQILVWHDLLGLQTELQPKFVKTFIKGKEILLDAINSYVAEVQSIKFPAIENIF